LRRFYTVFSNRLPGEPGIRCFTIRRYLNLRLTLKEGRTDGEIDGQTDRNMDIAHTANIILLPGSPWFLLPLVPEKGPLGISSMDFLRAGFLRPGAHLVTQPIV